MNLGVVVCSSCGQQLAAGAKFCSECGAAQASDCPSCGAPTQPGQKFCMECGTALGSAASPPTAFTPGGAEPAPRAERRLVSVLFADLVGFTTLSEHRDPEEVRELLSGYFDRCRTLIERYGGTVEKFIGDAVMAVWGTPVAREDDAERAVRAALALTTAVTALGEEVGMPELRVRAGVLTGNAAVDPGAEGEGMVLGDTVNSASRLQSIAAPGTVLVDDVTRRATEAAIDYEDAGAHAVKGREQPIHTWTALRVVAGVGGARRSAGLEAPLVGRERELHTVIEVAEDSATRRGARLVSVTGEAGTGKSRLLWEFFKYIDGIEERRWWHQGRCLAYGEGVSYWALAEMVRARAGITDEDDIEAERGKLQATIERYVTDERERRLVHPRLAQLLGLEQRSAGEAADLFAGWRLFFERMAAVQPLILAFEDLQWADSGLLDFIDYLLEWSADYPIYVLALGRPELEQRRPGWGTALRLTGLEPEAMRALLDGLVPGLPAELTARILDSSEGVPLYAVETVRMLLDRGVLTQEGSRYLVTGDVDNLEVPETLQALISARLDNLPAAERALLQDAAVLGPAFTAAAVAAVAERHESEIRPLLDELVTKQLLGRDDDLRSSEQGQYHFLQALLRTIALSTLSRRDRKARHLAAARHLQDSWGEDAEDIAEVLASHYLDAVAADPEAADAPEIRQRARRALVMAGSRAVSLALGAEARALYERAAALSESEVERARLLSEAGAAAGTTNRGTGIELLGEAIAAFEAAGADADAAETRLRLAVMLTHVNRLEDAGEMLGLAEPSLADPGKLAEVAAYRGKIAFLQQDFQRARDQSELALSIAGPRRLLAVIAEAAMNKGIALHYENRLHEAGAMMRMSLDIALEADLSEAALRAYFNLADFRAFHGDGTGANESIERGLTLARERGNRPWERDLLAQRVQCDLIWGAWDRALSTTAALEREDRDYGWRQAVGMVAPIYAGRGDLASLEPLRNAGETPSEWEELVMMEAAESATALAAHGEVTAAADRLGSILENALLDRVSTAVLIVDMVEILIAAGRLEAAAALGVRQPGTPILSGTQRRHAAALVSAAAGETERAKAELRAVLPELRQLGAPFMLARGLHDLAALMLSTDDDPEQAAAHLDEAEQLFASLGATVWLERGRELTARAAA